MEAYQEGISSGANRPMGLEQTTTAWDMVATARARSTSDLSSAISLKRCRLSPSPATGLVGMQENVFLNDFFECLGFFPLATRRMVRQAMVEIMLGANLSLSQESVWVGAGSLAEANEGGSPYKSEEWGWSQTLTDQDGLGDPPKCTLWCAIALGALLQGCPLDFVMKYVRRAQDSLVDCCSGTTVDTARANLAMAVLHKVLGDQHESNRTHLALVSNILERIPPDAAPTDMRSMLQTEGFDSNLFRQGTRGSAVHAMPKEHLEDIDHIPQFKDTVHEKDLSNILLVTDRRLRKAIFEDMCAQSVIASRKKEEEISQHGGSDGAPGALPFEGEYEEVKNIRAGEGLRAPLRLGSFVNKGTKNRSRRDTPAAGVGTKTFITNVFPQLARLSRAIERSDMCSGMIGFVYHSNMAYMNLIRGEMDSGFQSIKACARVITRFPGICRYRPHAVHSVLTVAALSMCRDVYSPLRIIYNSVLPKNATPAPLLENWHQGSICEALFCRSLQVELDRVGFGPSVLTSFSTSALTKPEDEEEVAASAQCTSSPGLHKPLTTEEPHSSSDCQSHGPQSLAVSPGVSLLCAGEVSLPFSDPRVNVAKS